MESVARAQFLREYLRDPRAIGSVVPDSNPCVQALLKGVPLAEARTVVEFGGASGSVTRQLCDRLNVNALFVCFESNPQFFGELQRTIHDRRLILTSRDAMAAPEVFRALDVHRGSVDAIISTLPCSNLPYDELLEGSVLPWLKPDGVFVQYMHVLSYFKGFSLKRVLSRHFGTVESTLVIANVPPVLIYHCTPRVNAQRSTAGLKRL